MMDDIFIRCEWLLADCLVVLEELVSQGHIGIEVLEETLCAARVGGAEFNFPYLQGLYEGLVVQDVCALDEVHGEVEP